MALQRKVVTLVEDYSYISRQDDAVDSPAEPTATDSQEAIEQKVKAAEDFEHRWERYTDGMAEPPLRPGVKPTVFHMRHMGNPARAKLAPYLHRSSEDISHFWEAAIAAFALSVRKVENCAGLDGRPVKLVTEMDDQGIHPVEMLTRESMEHFDMSVLIEVGGFAIKRLNPSPK